MVDSSRRTVVTTGTAAAATAAAPQVFAQAPASRHAHVRLDSSDAPKPLGKGMDRGDMENRIVSALMRTVGVMAAAAILATAVASDAVAQTPPSPTAAPSALPRSFVTPDVAKPAHVTTAPVKTTPTKQAKSCSIYGEGFVSVPGTDICIKAGGYLSTETGGHH